MGLDPQARAVLEQLSALGRAPVETLTPQEARAQSEAMPRTADPAVHSVQDRTIPGPAADIPIRIYTPGASALFPALVWFHGGGWVRGSVANTDSTVRRLVKRANCVAVSVDYRLAPESKFPAAAEDCFAAVQWVANNAASISVDPSKIAVAGTSAGGNLAAVVALMATDKGGPRLAGQVLIYPVIERNFDRRSYQENREGYLLTRSAMEWFWKLYLRADSDADHPYAAPIKANDLRGLAPALVITAEFDPLRDEGEAYAKRLSEADVPTVCTRYGGMFHGFFDIFDGMDESEAALRQVSQALNAAFAGRLRSARHRTTR